MDDIKTINDLTFFRELISSNEIEFERFFSVTVGAIGKFVYNRQFKVLYCSQGVLDIIGITAENRAKWDQNSSEYIYEEDYQYVYQEIGKYVESRQPFLLKYRLKKRAGQEVWIQAKGIFTNELYENQYPVMYMAFTDITASVRTKELLEQEVQRYKIFAQFVHESFFDYELLSDKLNFYSDNIDSVKVNKIWIINKDMILKYFYDNYECIDTEIELKLDHRNKCWFSLKAKGIYDSYGHLVKIIGTIKNIQKEKEKELKRIAYEEKLKNKAHYDQMTGLLNRFACEKIVNQMLEEKTTDITGIVIDVDNFKEINDIHGHFTGDQVLTKISRVFRKYCRSNDIAARLGGDEFFIMFIGQMQQDTIRARLQTMHQEIHNIARELNLEVPVSLSMGVTKIYSSDKHFSDIYVRADQTMYQAKMSGKSTLIYFNEDQES